MRLAVKTGWVVLVVGAMALLTEGLWATVHFEPTGDALAEERRGDTLVLVSSLLLLVLAALAYVVLRAPRWSTLTMVAAVALCVAVTGTEVFAPIALVAAYPMALGAAVSAVLLPRPPGRT